MKNYNIISLPTYQLDYVVYNTLRNNYKQVIMSMVKLGSSIVIKQQCKKT